MVGVKLEAVAHLDFETYSELNIKEVGGFRYAEDSSTEILIMAFALGKGPIVVVDMTKKWDKCLSKLEPLFNHIHKGGFVAAHNAHFERSIWEKTKQGKRFPVRPRPRQWDCTAARARMLAIPGSLEGAADAVGLNINKDKRGQALINKFSKPQIRRSKGVVISSHRITSKDDPEDFKAFMEYCARDVAVERELDLILPLLSEKEAKAFEVDYEINDRGMPVNLEAARIAEAWIEEYSEKLVKRAEEISGYRPSQVQKTREWLETRGVRLPNLQYDTVSKVLRDGKAPSDVNEFLESRIELSRAGTKKLKALQATASPDGRIRGGFLFSAASTRRWSSTGMQMHNLQKPEGGTDPELVFECLDSDPRLLEHFFVRPLTALAQSVRGFLQAPGTFGEKVMHVSDYSSVEPRGLAWMAGEEWMLEAYRNKEDLYRITAGRVYGKNPDKLAKEGPERFMGKQLVLGCGYGMGPPRFVETVARFGMQISLESSQEAVMGYRHSVPRILKFWKDMERGCIQATREWRDIRIGKVRFRPEVYGKNFEVLHVDMPSGSISYPWPSVGEQEWYGRMKPRFEFYKPLGSSFIHTDTFGGSIVENIIQALCRDILRDGLIAASEAGLKVVGHVHDEGISLGEDKKEELEFLSHCLSQSSPWAEGFPIEMEGYSSPVYKK